MPLHTYSADQYAEDSRTQEDDRMHSSELAATMPFPARSPLVELLPANRAQWTDFAAASAGAARSLTGLPLRDPSASKPEPLAFLPGSSPTKRAFRRQQLLQQQSAAAIHGLPVPMRAVLARAPPVGVERIPGAPQDGGLFAEFLASIESAGEGWEDSAAASPLLSSFAARTASRSPSKAMLGSGKGMPTASPMGEILATIRRKREGREAVEARKAREQAAREASERANSAERGATRCRSRSRSRSRSRPRARSAELREVAFSPAARSSGAVSSKENPIDVDLLQSYLEPLGLTFSSLGQLAAADVEKLAEAVRSNTTAPVFPRAINIPVAAGGALAGRPLSASAKQSEVIEAAKHRCKAHFVAHSKTAEQAAAAFEQECPSIAALRAQPSLIAPSSTASGHLLLPSDPALLSAAVAQHRKAHAERMAARPGGFNIRMEHLEDDPPEPTSVAPGARKNLPIATVIPPSKLEQLLERLGSVAVPTLAQGPLASSKSRVQRERSIQAIEAHRAAVAAKEAPEKERILAAREAIEALGATTRARNRAKVMRRKHVVAATAPAASAAASSASAVAPSSPLRVDVTPSQFVQHLAAGSTPSHAYSLDRLFGRVVVRPAGVWREIEASLEARAKKRKEASSAPTAAPLPPEHPLSASGFSFLIGGDTLSRLLLTPPSAPLGQHNWLRNLGFERRWMERRVSDGFEFKLLVFRGVDTDKDKKETKGIETHRTTWDNVFSFMLARILAQDAAVPLAENEARRVVLDRLVALRSEIESTPFTTVAARALEQGLPHVYEGRDALSIAQAAHSVRLGSFDLVQARRFLHDHLHLTALFTGDGFATPERDEDNAEEQAIAAMMDSATGTAAEAEDPSNPAVLRSHQRSQEYVMQTRSIESLPGLRVAPLHFPLGRPTESPRSRSASASAPFSARARSTSPAASTLGRARFRSRPRGIAWPATSRLDTGLIKKPGTAAFAELQALKEQQAAAEEQRKKSEIEAKRAARAAKAAMRKKFKRKSQGGGASKKKKVAPTPAAVTAVPTSAPFDFAGSSTSAPSSFPYVVPSAEFKEDEYGAEGFEADQSAVAAATAVAPAATDASAPADLPSSGAASGVMAAALAAAALHAPATSSNKKQKRSSKKQGAKTKESAAPAKRHPPLKPALPAPIARAASPPKAKQSEAAAQATSSLEPAPSMTDAPVADFGPPLVPRPVPSAPAAPTAEEVRRRKQSILLAQKAARHKELRAAKKKAQESEERRKANLRKLHQMCNAIVRPQSAAVAPTSAAGAPAAVPESKSAEENAASDRTASAGRARSASAPRRSRSRSASASARLARDRAFDDAEGIVPDDVLDRQVAEAIIQSDLIAAEAARKREQARLEKQRERDAELAAIAALGPMHGGPPSPRYTALKQLGVVKRSDLPTGPGPRVKHSTELITEPIIRRAGTVSRSLSPSELDAESKQAGTVSRSFDLDSPAPVQAPRNAAIASSVTQMAAQLSTRFSSLLERMADSGGMEKAVVYAAYKSHRTDTSSLPPPADADSNEPYEHRVAAHQLRVALEHQADLEVHEQVHQRIIPPEHLQEPVQRVQPESRLDPSQQLHAPLLEGAPAWVSSVLLPAEISQAPFPQGFNRAPLPSGASSVSSHALLFAEHTPDAASFIAGISASAQVDDNAQRIASSAPRLPARPFYDLATREYAALQDRIQQQKARYQFLQ